MLARAALTTERDRMYNHDLRRHILGWVYTTCCVVDLWHFTSLSLSMTRMSTEPSTVRHLFSLVWGEENVVAGLERHPGFLANPAVLKALLARRTPSQAPPSRIYLEQALHAAIRTRGGAAAVAALALEAERFYPDILPLEFARIGNDVES